MNKTERLKRIALRLITHWSSVGPLAVGLTALVGAMQWPQLLLVFLASIALSVGAVFTRLTLSGAEIAHDVMEEIEKELRDLRDESLSNLYDKLSRDRDKRDEQLLLDLRGLALSFERGKSWYTEANRFAILRDVDALFQACLQQLERSYDLKVMADNLATKEAKKPLLDGRERIIAEVQKSVASLSHILAGVSQLEMDYTDKGDDSQLQRIRRELEESLQIAFEVGEDIKKLDNPRRQRTKQ